MKKPFGDFWKGSLLVRREHALLRLETSTATIAPPNADSNVLTLEKLLKVMKDLPPAPTITELRCNEKMIPDARLAGFPVVVTNLVPDGYILVVKRGPFGPEVAGIVGPEKKTDLDASK